MMHICFKDGKRCYIHYTKDRLFEHHCRHGSCELAFPCQMKEVDTK